MAIHHADRRAGNPRLKCSSLCGRWMRLHGHQGQRFYGSCEYTGGDHLAGAVGPDGARDVCTHCCAWACEEIAIARAAG